MEKINQICLIAFATLVVFGNCRSNAENVNCPTDLEADLADAFKTCADEMKGKDSKALLESLGNDKKLLKSIASMDKLEENERSRRSLNITLLKREILDVNRFRRSLLNVSLGLLHSAPEEEHLLTIDSQEDREKREDKKSKDEMKKEVGELVVCAVEKLIKEQPVLQKSIEECAKSNNKNDDESQKKFEKCVEDRIKQMCPNLKLN